MKVEHIVSESGDWAVLRVNGKNYASGHSIPDHEWMELLAELGAEIDYVEISDKEMEEENY